MFFLKSLVVFKQILFENVNLKLNLTYKDKHNADNLDTYALSIKACAYVPWTTYDSVKLYNLSFLDFATLI